MMLSAFIVCITTVMYEMYMYWNLFFVQEAIKCVSIILISAYSAKGTEFNHLNTAIQVTLLSWCASSTTGIILVYLVMFILEASNKFYNCKQYFINTNNCRHGKSKNISQALTLQLTFKDQRLIDIETYNSRIVKLNSPYLEKDNLGWLIPKSTLDTVLEIAELKGFVLDWDNSNGPIITIYYKPADKGNGLLSFTDIRSMLQIDAKEVKSICFSLDPALERSYYQSRSTLDLLCLRRLTSLYIKRSEPAKLGNTGIMDTLFHADYILKFLVIGSEVSAKFPYEVRPVKHLIEHLPQHLQHAIRPPHTRETIKCLCPHRVWIDIKQLDYESHVSDGKEFYYIKSVDTKVNTKSLGKFPTSLGHTKFAEDLTSHYTELSQYFPIFARLVELSKLQFVIKTIHERLAARHQNPSTPSHDNVQLQSEKNPVLSSKTLSSPGHSQLQTINDVHLVPSSFTEHEAQPIVTYGGVQMEPTYQKFPYVPDVSDTLTNSNGIDPILLIGELGREGGIRFETQGVRHSTDGDSTLPSRFGPDEGLKSLELAMITSLVISRL